MVLEYAILGFLSCEPMTGYDLKTRCFDAAAGHIWTADQAQVYRTLDRLAQRGFVKSRLVPQRGKPDRRVFSIAPAGRDALVTWLRSPSDPSVLRDPFLLHLFFAPGLSDDEILGMLAHARDTYQHRLEGMRVGAREDLEDWERRTGFARDAELRRMTLDAGTSVTRSAIDWLDDCIERVKGGLPTPASGAAKDGGTR